MKFLYLFAFIAVSFTQYQLEWEVLQDVNEYGHAYFDIDGDGVNEVSKQYLNSVILYDGADSWNMVWSLTDEDHEYLTFWDLYDFYHDSTHWALMVGADLYSRLSFNLQMFAPSETAPRWISSEFTGYVAGLDVYDTDGDGISEIILAVTNYDEQYSARIVIVSSLTGRVKWSGQWVEGYYSGIYADDPDADGMGEILVNRYDAVNSEYTLHLLSAVGNTCIVGDANEDGSADVLDVVQLVECVLSGCGAELNICSDPNQDGALDVLDIVSIVGVIMSGEMDVLSDYAEEWAVAQGEFEYGHLLFDTDNNGVNDLVKQLGNTVSVYDGVNDWELSWLVQDDSADVFTLYRMADLDSDGSEEGLFVASTLDVPAFRFSLFPAMETGNLWVSSWFEGYLSWADVIDLDLDGVPEIVAGRTVYDTTTVSEWFVLSGATGNVLWQSEILNGSLVGPFTGNIDTDSLPEILINLYDAGTDNYTLSVYSYSGAAGRAGSSSGSDQNIRFRERMQGFPQSETMEAKRLMGVGKMQSKTF